MPTGASLRGREAFQRKLRNFAAKFPDEVGRALYQETQVEATEVKRRTPVDKGTLRGTVHVVGPVILHLGDGKRVIYCLVVAGGPAAPYAIYVHEDPDAFHKVGEWKFVENPLKESRPYIAARVARRISLNRAAS